MVACVDAQRDTYGVESICQHLPIAPATYWRHKAWQSDPTRRSVRAQRDEVLKRDIARVWDEHEQVNGAEKVWRQLGREQIRAARCTVERLGVGPPGRRARRAVCRDDPSRRDRPRARSRESPIHGDAPESALGL
jgi:hypothetical protein